MPQDAFTLNYLVKELNQRFKGGKINKIVQPENEKIVFTVYTGKGIEKLYLDVNPASPKIGVYEDKDQAPITAPNFCMLMRKHLQNATIDSISLIPFDRIVKIDFVQKGEFFSDAVKTVYVELMGRYSNVILTENGKVLGGNRGVNFFDNGVRPLIVGRDYVFPPTSGKKLASDDELIKVINKVEKSDISKFLFENVSGISIETAREIATLYIERTEKKGNIELSNFLTDFLYNSEVNPVVYFDKDKAKDVCVFPYKTISGEQKFFSSLIEAENYYFSNKESQKKIRNKKDKLSGILSALIKKNKKKISAISQREKEALNAEDNRIKGELLLANIYRLNQGEKVVVLDNYYDGSKIEILLDEHISIAKNSERYYKKYNKQKRALEALIPQKESAISEGEYLASVYSNVEIAESYLELNLIEEELIETGIIKEKKSKVKKSNISLGFNQYEINGYRVKVGRNNIENDTVTFSAKPTDIWMHAKDYHSAHLIIETNGESIEKISDELLIKCAEICSYYSGARESGKCEVV